MQMICIFLCFALSFLSFYGQEFALHTSNAHIYNYASMVQAHSTGRQLLNVSLLTAWLAQSRALHGHISLLLPSSVGVFS